MTIDNTYLLIDLNVLDSRTASKVANFPVVVRTSKYILELQTDRLIKKRYLL